MTLLDSHQISVTVLQPFEQGRKLSNKLYFLQTDFVKCFLLVCNGVTPADHAIIIHIASMSNGECTDVSLNHPLFLVRVKKFHKQREKTSTSKTGPQPTKSLYFENLC